MKGASGLLCCLLCSNVCSLARDEDTLIDGDDSGTLVDIRCTFDECRLRSDGSLFAQADDLVAAHGHVNSVTFKNLEKASGLTYRPEAALWDERFRKVVLPITMTRYDPTHIFYSNGVIGKELELLLSKLAGLGVRFDTLATFFGAAWRSPLRKLRMDDYVNDARAKHFRKTGNYAARASDIMAIVPVMRHFLYSVGLFDRIEAPVSCIRKMFPNSRL